MQTKPFTVPFCKNSSACDGLTGKSSVSEIVCPSIPNMPLFVDGPAAGVCLPSGMLLVIVRYFFENGQLSEVGARTTVFVCKNVISRRGKTFSKRNTEDVQGRW